jgi:predicted nucleic acid-binding protein
MRYIETSFLLGLITKKPLAAYPFCEKMYEGIKAKKLTTGLSLLTIFEIVYTLQRREKRSRQKIITELSRRIEELKPKILNVEDGVTLQKVLSVWQKYEEGMFNDILHYFVMRKYGISEIYSIDEHFDVFKDIKRVVGE